MSLMKFRNQKGFTLIEMMIVIAVIAILAAVLIPKSGLVQKTAKESGVEANARVVQGLVENMMPRYEATDAARGELITDAAKKLDAAGIVNPFSRGTDVLTAAASTAAVVYSASAPTNLDTITTARAGVVWVEIPATATNPIKIYPFDKDGVLIPKATATLE